MEGILRRAKQPYYQYEPYYNRRDGKPSWQWKFLAAIEQFVGRVAIGANQIGKSKQGAYEAALAVTGENPYRQFPDKGNGWVVGLDNKMVDRIDRPMFEYFLPEEFKSHFDKQKNIWYCDNNKRSWKIEFLSTEMGREKFQGAEVDFIWFDEEPKKTEIFNECMMRLAARKGIWWMTATPVLGTAWLKELSEREDVFDISASLWDNPYVPESEIKRLQKDYPEEEADVRIEGIYIVFGGRPVFRTYIRALTDRLKQLKDEPSPRIGFVESCAA